MSFLTNPASYTRTARTSRDVIRDSCALELPDPPDRGGHRWVVPTCLLAGLALIAILVWERIA